MTWEFLSSSSENTTSTSPSAVFTNAYTGWQVGDLCVLIGSWKNSSDITLPAGWTVIGKELLGTDTTTSTTVASGIMAYLIHDGRSGDEIFTLDVGVVGTFRVARYRHPAGVVFDTGASRTATSSSIAVGIHPGLLVSAANSLLIFSGSSGRSLQVNGYRSVDPAGEASTTIDTTTPPTAGQWIRRGNFNSTAGSDYALGFADAVKSAPGLTGPIAADFSVAHLPAVFAAAFRPANSPPDLSGYDLVAIDGFAGTSTQPLSSWGDKWVKVSGADMWIHSTQSVYRYNRAVYYLDVPISSPDYIVEADLIPVQGFGLYSWWGVMARYGTDGVAYAGGIECVTTTEVRRAAIFKLSGSAWSRIASSASVAVGKLTPEHLILTVEGNTISLETSTCGTVTIEDVSPITAEGRAGFHMYNYYNHDDVTLDNFSIRRLGGNTARQRSQLMLTPW